MVNGIIGKKIGMTQLFLEDGTVEPATVLQAGPCVVVQAKTAQTRRLRGRAARPGRGQAATRPTRRSPATTRRPTCRRRACAARCKRRQGRRGAEARRPGARARSSTRASASTSSARARATASRAWSSATTSRGGDGDARLDVPPRARLDRRLVLSVARRQGHAHARAHGRGPHDRAQPQGAAASTPRTT